MLYKYLNSVNIPHGFQGLGMVLEPEEAEKRSSDTVGKKSGGESHRVLERGAINHVLWTILSQEEEFIWSQQVKPAWKGAYVPQLKETTDKKLRKHETVRHISVMSKESVCSKGKVEGIESWSLTRVDKDLLCCVLKVKLNLGDNKESLQGFKNTMGMGWFAMSLSGDMTGTMPSPHNGIGELLAAEESVTTFASILHVHQTWQKICTVTHSVIQQTH